MTPNNGGPVVGAEISKAILDHARHHLKKILIIVKYSAVRKLKKIDLTCCKNYINPLQARLSIACNIFHFYSPAILLQVPQIGNIDESSVTLKIIDF